MTGFKAPVAASDWILVGGRSRAASFLKGSWLVSRHLQLLEMISSSTNEGTGPTGSTGGIGPEWVLEQHWNQQEINAQVIRGLRTVQESIASLTPTLSQIPAPETTVQETEPAQKARHSLSYPDKYDRKNKTAYPAFKGHLRAKLRIDQVAIRGEPEQV